MEFIKKHPIIWAVICFLVVTLPQWIEATWSLFSSEPLVQVISRKWRGVVVPDFSPFWITVPLGLFMFGILLWQLRKREPEDKLVTKKHIRDLHDVKLATESPLSIFMADHSKAVYFVIERFILTNASTSDTFNLNIHLLIHGLRNVQPLQQPLEQWESLQSRDEAMKVNFISFPLRILPQSFLCGYIAFRFQDIGDFTESMFGDTKLTFIVAACKRFEAELVLTDLESEQNQVFGFFLSTLVSTFSTTMLDEKYIPSSLRLSPNPIEIKRLL